MRSVRLTCPSGELPAATKLLTGYGSRAGECVVHTLRACGSARVPAYPRSQLSCQASASTQDSFCVSLRRPGQRTRRASTATAGCRRSAFHHTTVLLRGGNTPATSPRRVDILQPGARGHTCRRPELKARAAAPVAAATATAVAVPAAGAGAASAAAPALGAVLAPSGRRAAPPAAAAAGALRGSAACRSWYAAVAPTHGIGGGGAGGATAARPAALPASAAETTGTGCTARACAVTSPTLHPDMSQEAAGGREATGQALGNADATASGGGGGDGGGSGAWPPPAERLAAVAERLRRRPQAQYPPVSSRAAAVLVGLFEDRRGVVRVLLTQRSTRLKSHRGEVCLPGGKRDEGDADDAATAVREAHEELGLDPSRVTVLGCLPPVLSKHHLSVTPVLALVPPDAVPAPNPHEVAAAFTVPLAVFLGQLSDPRVGQPGLGGGGAADGGVNDDGDGVGGGDAAAEWRGEDGGDGAQAGRRTRRRTAATAAAECALPGPLSWRAAEASGGGAAGSGGAAAGGAGSSAPAIRDDCVYASVQHEFRDICWVEHTYRIHYFQYGDFNVWGLTATICIAAAQLALGRQPAFEEQCPGGQHYSCFYWDGAALRVREACADLTDASGPSGAEASAEAALGMAAAVEAGGEPVASPAALNLHCDTGNREERDMHQNSVAGVDGGE